MKFEKDNEKFLLNRKLIYTAPGELRDFVVDEFNRQVYLVYDATAYMPEGHYPKGLEPKHSDSDKQMLVNQNVMCISFEGEIIWRIEPTSEYPLQHLVIMQDNDEIWSRISGPYEYKIDKKTGKILDKRHGI